MPQPTPRISLYLDWLASERGLRFAHYEALWTWSVTDLEGFWRSIWDYFDVHSPTPFARVIGPRVMPGAVWFEGAKLNYTQQVFRHAQAAHAAGHPAVVFQNERMAAPVDISWPDLQRQVGALAQQLQTMGVRSGDRVCAYLPNTPHAIIAFLACASIGAVWSVCSPDMGPVAVLDRFRQIEPVVLVAVDGQCYGGLHHDRRPVVREVLAGLPSVRHVILLADLDPRASAAEFATPDRQAHDFGALVAADPGEWECTWVPFDHPLWIVYSSGTTGLPKPIVHGQGGVLLEQLKGGVLHNDLAPSVETGDRFLWYTSTGWVVWNSQPGALLGGTTVCVYDGNPGGAPGPGKAPDMGTLWRFAAASKATMFGAGAAFYASCLKSGVVPQDQADLSRLRVIGSTGSPLSEDCHEWIWQHMPQNNGQRIWINSISGGTDTACAFVGGLRTLPTISGEMQVRCLGAAIQAYGEADAQGQGQALINEVGELVCTEPMPSMPLRFWGDDDGSRYHSSYFDMYRHADEHGQGRAIWRHGDWIRIVPRGASGDGAAATHHGAVIYGRSDATINRHGIRMGTAELYRAVEALPEVLDSLVVDLEYLGRESWMALFVVLREGWVLNAELQTGLRQVIKAALSARHVPNDIYQVDAVPRTLSGKKMELPVKKLLMGAAPDKVMNRDAMANAASVDWFVAFAHQRARAAAKPS